MSSSNGRCGDTALQTAMQDVHARALAALTGFRRSCLVGETQQVYQRFLRVRRDILAYLVWEEFSLLGPFRDRLPQLAELQAVTADVVSHRDIRASLAAIALMLKTRKAGRDVERALVEHVDRLEQMLAAHTHGVHSQLCPALESILSDDDREALERSLQALNPQPAR